MWTSARDVAGTWVPRVAHRFFDSMTWRLPEAAVDAAAGSTGDGPRVSLTFDDGPTPRTGDLLGVLADFGVPATHFLLGENAERRPEDVRRIADAGHQVGNHSWSHPDGWRTPMRPLIAEYVRTDRLLSDLSGEPVRWVRPPFGKFTYALIRWAERRGQRVAMWDTMPCDYSPRGTPKRVAQTLRSASDRSIVCLHDNPRASGVTPGVLKEWLPRLIDAGWRFERLS